MGDGIDLRLSVAEARGLMLAAQGLLDPPREAPGTQHLRGTIERLGVLQIDTISVVERTQYLVLWSRLGVYNPVDLDALLFPDRSVFEYWSHAASIVPMRDYAYYRPTMLRHAQNIPAGDRAWLAQNAETIRYVQDAIRERGPLASADFERPADARRSGPWDWHGPKESRRALDVLWTTGELMVHSRRRGQKRYDLRERVLREAFGAQAPCDHDLPGPVERQQYFARHTVRSLGVTLPSWLWDYFRLRPIHAAQNRRLAALEALHALQRDGTVVSATIDGLHEPAFVARELLPDLERLRAGFTPVRTTLLSPFDSLIWDRARARGLFDYEVCFEAYVPPARRRFGYYCLAILHRGRIVGRLDPKFDRAARRLLVRALYLEAEVQVSDDLVCGLGGAIRDLARFLGATAIAVERSDPASLAPALAAHI